MCIDIEKKINFYFTLTVFTLTPVLYHLVFSLQRRVLNKNHKNLRNGTEKLNELKKKCHPTSFYIFPPGKNNTIISTLNTAH